MNEFHRSLLGQRFFERDIPSLISAVEGLISAVEGLEREWKRTNDLKEKELGIRSKEISEITSEFVRGDKGREGPVKFPKSDE